MARPPKPTALKILTATGKKAAKLAKREIETPGDIGEPPAWMTPDQRDVWRHVVEFAPRDVLKRIDATLLSAYVVAQDTHRRAAVEIAKGGLIVKSTKSTIMQSPYMAILNQQANVMTRIATEFGFSPVSRARIESARGDKSAPSNDWDGLA